MEDSTSQGDQMTEDFADDRNIPGAGKMVDDDHDGGADNMPDDTDVDDNRGADDHGSNQEPDTFDRAYVEKLRQENGKYRQRAQRADELAHRLHRALVEQTGRLQDPSDLPFDEDHLGGADKMVAAIDELLTAKPHLAARRVTGDVGQGASKPSDGVNLLNILRGN